MMDNKLVRAILYNKNIAELPITKRIETKYPILVRIEVAQKLAKIAEKLPNSLQLQIDSGYRSRKTQEKIWEFRYKQFKKNYKKNTKLSIRPQNRNSSSYYGRGCRYQLNKFKYKERD